MARKAAKTKTEPYPFETLLDQGTRKFQGRVMRLTQTAALIEVGAQLIKVGEAWTFVFTLPNTEETLTLKAKIIKTYRKLVGPKNEVERMGEFYFIGVTEAQKRSIHTFLVKTNQVVKI